ncbi:caspase family protein [Roseibium salinum]|uniref:Caspase family protein n=1 Tax=Roseibium salinum TaxID=1604349 RepID=A0ABT3QWW4_9HYPH|nr:caspase family protein [Roseibium sp. DSM 29163]MCX2721390.1 caspase family protein [Roseibium sp. DSM 29163]
MSLLRVFFAAACLLATAFAPAGAASGARLALIIGNGAYSNVTPLDNPVNDAELMAKSLAEVGFDVTLITEATQDELIQAISAFGRKLREAGEDATGLFYYAGHGVQSFGTNYLLPVDIALQDAADLSLVGVPAQAVLRQMFSARNRTNIVILDACRNNPFASVPDLSDNGLAEMKAPRGTFLAYSTAPGDIAVDGDGSNSPFTEALARHLPTPGQPIEALFKDVRVEVLKSTGGNQTPWDTSSLTVDFQFMPAAPVSPEFIEQQQLWHSVRLSQDPVQVLLFLRANPEGPYTEEARALLTELMSKEAQTTPPPVAKSPVPVDPDKQERELIEQAREAGTAEAYQAYLEAFPDGAFSELARLELQTIVEKLPRTDPISDPPIVAAPEPEAPSSDLPEAVAFNAPIGGNDPQIATRSIEELITGSPLFPPIEGLPEAVWKDKTCSSCHQWNQTNLCDQAKTYVADNARAVSKQHPYGSSFKQALRVWAHGGCN